MKILIIVVLSGMLGASASFAADCPENLPTIEQKKLTMSIKRPFLRNVY